MCMPGVKLTPGSPIAVDSASRPPVTDRTDECDRRTGSRRHPDLPVDGNRALGGGEDRVEVELDDVRARQQQVPGGDDDVGQRVEVDGPAAAGAGEQGGAPEAAEQRTGLGAV